MTSGTKEPNGHPILRRVWPLVEVILAHYRISEEEAQEILEECCTLLAHRLPDLTNPELWLLQMVLRRCRERREGDRDDDGRSPP